MTRPLTVQIINLKTVSNTTHTRYRVILSDGQHFMQGMLATQVNSLVVDGTLKEMAVIVARDVITNLVSEKNIAILLGFDVVENPGSKIGNPVDYETVFKNGRGVGVETETEKPSQNVITIDDSDDDIDEQPQQQQQQLQQQLDRQQQQQQQDEQQRQQRQQQQQEQQEQQQTQFVHALLYPSATPAPAPPILPTFQHALNNTNNNHTQDNVIVKKVSERRTR